MEENKESYDFLKKENNYVSTEGFLSLEPEEKEETYYAPNFRQTIKAGEYANERDIEIKALKKMAGHNNNAFVLGLDALDQKIPLGMIDYVKNKWKEETEQFKEKTNYKQKFAWEFAKGYTLETAKAPYKFTGYMATNSLPLIAKAATSAYALSGAAGGTERADRWVREMNKGIDAWTKEIERITGIDKDSTVERMVGGGMASVWGSVLMGGMLGSGAVAPIFGLTAAQDTYVRQREEGVGMGESLGRALWHGTGETMLEYLQFNRIMGALAKKSRPIKILKDMFENSVQEAAQQANELGANWNVDHRNLAEKTLEILESAGSGAIASLAGSAGGHILDKKTIKDVTDLMKRTGHTDQEIQTVRDSLNAITDSDELERAAHNVANDELTTIALTYKEQAQAASEEIVNQLDNTIKANELVNVPGELSSERPADMKPLYQLGQMQIDTEKNPALGMVLYQAEQEGKPFQTLGQVVQWAEEKIGVENAQKMFNGVSSVYQQTYKALKDIGQDDALADRNARMRSAAAFSLAKVMDSTVEEADKALGNIVSQKASDFDIQQRKPDVEFNAVTFENPENQKAVKDAFLRNGFSEKSADDAINNLQRVVDFAKQIGSERLQEQNERNKYVEQRPTEDVSKYEPEEMSLAVQSDKKTLGLVPRVSVFVKNGEYQYNIDFGTTCTRREPLEAAVRIMIDMGKANNLGLSQINNIKDILGKHGFTKPCVLCFVEGKRTYELISANRLSRQWNVVLKSLGVQDAKVIGTERPISDDLLQRLKELADGSGYEKYVDKQYRDKSEKDPVGLTKSRAKTIANIMLSEYERTGKSTLINRMRPDMLMNSRGTDYLFRKYIADAPTLKGLIAARDGAGTPKPHTSYPVYDITSWKEIFDLKKDIKKEVKHLYDIGGVRLQSFSDFNEYMVVDYLQAMLDLAARRLPAHSYTKVTSFVELFGEMLNINMSLIGNTSRDIPVEYDGLKPAGKGDRVVLEDENGKWTYNWATESFDPSKAFELRRQVRFNGKVGTVGIGISDKMIESMLNDPEIDMIIPFHKSGIQDHVLISAGFKRADGTSVKDYSDYQNTKRPKGVDDYLFNEHMQELKDAKNVAKDYLKWCKEHKYTPKFEQFSNHENYFKLLEDFRSYDNDGKPVIQKAVEFKLADNFNDILKDAIKNRDEVVSAISNIQNNKALMSDLEEAVRYAHLDGEVKKVMLDKVTKALGGKENVKVLSQEDMFDELAKTDPKKAQEFRDGKGVLYGFAKEGKIYLNVQGFNAHTPVHEYAHLWAKVVQSTNKDLWKRGVSLLEKSDKWKELASKDEYKELLKDKDRFASEVFAQIVGENNEEIAKYFQDPNAPEYKNKSLKSKILQFIKDVFGHIRSMFDPKFDPSDVQSAKDFATMSLLDLYDENRSDALAQKIKEMRKKGEFLSSAEQQAKPMYQEQEGTPKGAYYNNTTYLFENADQSTFVHEMSHAYMDALQNLADDGNAKAQRDLDVIRKWLGKKKGQEFTQADWERFARGFEMYLREGKAPNEYLGGTGGVFDSFKNWLMNIYAGIKSLVVTNEKGQQEPVKINQQIKDFYDEMLGGEDIDKVIRTAQEGGQALQTLQNKMQELADMQQVLAEERAKLVREMANSVKPDTTWANVKDWGNNLWESARDLPINVLQSSYARLAKIDPRLGLLVQRAEQSQGLRIKRWTDQVKPFFDAFNKLSDVDKAKVQFYLLNQQWGEVEDLIGKENTDAVRNMLKEIYDELIASGVEVGYRDNYFPRSVLDYDGLLQEMGLTYPALRKEMEEAIGKDATPEEQAEWLDKHIMGFKGNVSTKGNKYTKERKLDLITDKMAQYYKPSMETLVNYVEGMAKLLSMREAFGKDIENKEGKDSIGKIIENMLGEKNLSKKQIDEVRNVLSALYLPNGMGNKFLQAMRQYGYATKLSFSTTIRQFADIGMMMKVNGVLNTLDALFHPDKRITLENLGIDPLGEEFQTSKKDVGGKIANFTTKWRGINWADAVMKNAYMRGSYKALQDLAKTPEKFHEKYDALFGDETDTIIKDLNDNKLSEPVKVLLFHEISKIQPISRSAMPTAYLSNPNGRVFYMFKTFSLHRAEYMVSELIDDFRNGDLKKAGKDIMADVAVIGWEGLVELLIAFLKYGWQAFAAKEVLDTFAGAGLGVLGLNKHQALQLTRGQVGDFFQEMVGVGTPLDDVGYMIRHADDPDKLLRAVLPDMILEPLIAGPKPLNKKSKAIR